MNALPSWLLYALLSAFFASLVGILGKIGMHGVDSTLATALRSGIMTVFLVSVCTAVGAWEQVARVDRRALGMIALSGLAGAASWLFYFKAIQSGNVSQVAPLDKLSVPLTVVLATMLLGEKPSGLNWTGVVMIAAGAYLAALPGRS